MTGKERTRRYNERWVDCAAADAAYERIKAVQNRDFSKLAELGREFSKLTELGQGLLRRIRGRKQKDIIEHTTLMQLENVKRFAACCGVPVETLLANGDGLRPLKTMTASAPTGGREAAGGGKLANRPASRNSLDINDLQQSASRGEAEAQYHLGTLYSEGLGVKRDLKQALHWIVEAAKQDHIPAQIKAGDAFFFGEGVPQSWAEAERRYRKAAEQGDALAQYELAQFYCESGAYPEAARWFRRSALQGNRKAMFELAFEYESGRRWEGRDYVEAARWYREAAELGEMTAQRCLGQMYHEGRGVERDYSAALQWYIKAANQGEPYAAFEIGNLYRDGLGVAQDYNEALRWYRKSAQTDQVEALVEIGAFYCNGQGVAQDYGMAMRWFTQAAIHGNADAQYQVGALYSNGCGVRRDLVQARVWMERSAEGGHEDAKRWLAAHETA